MTPEQKLLLEGIQHELREFAGCDNGSTEEQRVFQLYYDSEVFKKIHDTLFNLNTQCREELSQ